MESTAVERREVSPKEAEELVGLVKAATIQAWAREEIIVARRFPRCARSRPRWLITIERADGGSWMLVEVDQPAPAANDAP